MVREFEFYNNLLTSVERRATSVEQIHSTLHTQRSPLPKKITVAKTQKRAQNRN